MVDRIRRPAPRTLAAAPLQALRAPQSARHLTRIPALATLIASGVSLPACHEPVCGTTRGDELEAHGARVIPSLREGRAGEALREVGVALGVTPHASVSATTSVTAPGRVAAVTTTPPMPPVSIVPHTVPSGGEGSVTPLPTAMPLPPTPQTPTTIAPIAPTSRGPLRTMGHMRRVTTDPRSGER